MTRVRALSLVFVLLLANLGWWAWQAWYAPPARGSVPWRAPGAKDAQPAAAIPGVGAVRLAGEAGASPPPSGAASTTAEAAADAPPTTCYEVGPFTASADSAAAAELLRQRGLAPRPGYAAGVAPLRFVVRIDGLPTAADQSRVMLRLRAAGLADVAALPAERAVSVGVFTEAARAATRLQQAEAAGFAPRILPQYAPDAEHWLRVDLAASPPGPAAAQALAGAWRVQACAASP